MKKILLGAAALSVVFATSCKKSDDNNSTPSNTWTVDGKSYTAITVQKQSQSGYVMLAGADASGHYMYFLFSSYPSASGTYKVSDGTTSGANQVAVMTGTTTNAYMTTGNDNISAAVTVNNGKVSVTLPDAWAAGVTSSDSVKIKGSLTEQ